MKMHLGATLLIPLLLSGALAGETSIGSADSGTLSGRVSDSGYGGLLKDVNVTLDDGTHSHWTQTDEHGEYSLKDLPPGHYNVSIYLPRYEEYRSDIVLRSGPTELSFHINLIVPAADQPRLGFHGAVVGADNKPIKAAEVMLVSPFDDHVSVSAKTEPDGRYSIGAPRPGQYILYASKPGFETQASTALTGEALVTVDFKLPPFHMPEATGKN